MMDRWRMSPTAKTSGTDVSSGRGARDGHADPAGTIPLASQWQVHGPGFAYVTERENVSGLFHQRRAGTGLACLPEPDEIECELNVEICNFLR